MACYKPITAHQVYPGARVNFAGIGKPLKLPCGGCIGCRAERSKSWAIRVMHEAQLHEANCFVTLTYAQDKLPDNGKLYHPHFQQFMHKLRAACRRALLAPGGNLRFPTPLPSEEGDREIKGPRYYMAGEYGEKHERPHFHAALFGCDFTDRIYHKTSESGATIYTSATLEQLWGKGFTSIGDLTFESAAYIARYVMKKRTGTHAKEHYRRFNAETGEIYYLTPEYNRMSLKPGIGRDWFQAYREDVYKGGTNYQVIMNGQTHKPPRYYDKIMKQESPGDWEPIAQERETKAKEDPNNTPARLKVREAVDTAKLNHLKRGKTE